MQINKYQCNIISTITNNSFSVVKSLAGEKSNKVNNGTSPTLVNKVKNKQQNSLFQLIKNLIKQGGELPCVLAAIDNNKLALARSRVVLAKQKLATLQLASYLCILWKLDANKKSLQRYYNSIAKRSKASKPPILANATHWYHHKIFFAFSFL